MPTPPEPRELALANERLRLRVAPAPGASLLSPELRRGASWLALRRPSPALPTRPNECASYRLAPCPQMLAAGLLNNGQACAAQTRFLARRSRYREVVDAMAEGMRAMKVGSSLDPATQIGPVVARRQRDKILGYLEAGRREGARVAIGGGAPKELRRGWFIEPTLFADVDNRMTIAREEIFGPVLVVIPYDGEEQAVAIANDSDFGLGGGIWCGDTAHGVELATRLRTGTVTVNTAMLLDFNSPFGGFKKSGIGRELGPEGLAPYTEYQSIIQPAGG